MPKAIPHCYQDKHGTYYVRAVLPVELRTLYSGLPRDIRHSLRTKCRSGARKLSRSYMSRLDALVYEILKMSSKKVVAPKTVTQALKSVKPLRVELMTFDTSTGVISLDKPTRDEIDAAKELMSHRASIAPASLQSPNQHSTQKLSELVSEFMDSKVDDVAPKTHKAYRSSLNLLIEIAGDVPASSLTPSCLTRFRDDLKSLPANMRKMPGTRDKTVKQILKMGLKPRKPSATNNVLSDTRLFLSWAQDHRLIELSPSLLKNVKERHINETSQRRPWKLAELQMLFDGYIWRYDDQARGEASRGRERVNHDKFWVPLVGIFTGAREEEICSLKPSEIALVDGVWCFDMPYFDQATGMISKKNRSSGRVIPIHRTLLELGLADYAQDRLSAGAEMLFEGIVLQQGRYSQAFSKWFGRTLKKKVGLPTGDHTIMFHTFRNDVIDQFILADIPEDKYSRVTGHTTGGVANRIYSFRGGKIYPPSQLVELINVLHYEGLDLSHVSFDAFCKQHHGFLKKRTPTRRKAARHG